MRIYSLSKVIALPVALIALYVGYQMFWGSEPVHWSIVLVPVALGVALYLFHPQIDHWYLEKNPIPADPVVVDWLSKYDAYYQSLDASQKLKFEQRIMLYQHGRAFEAIGQEDTQDVPFDISCILAAQAVKHTMNQDDYLLGDMDRIFLYKHPFPTPRYKFLHTVETQIEDGVYIFALDYLMPGLTNPDRFYNIGGHGFAEAYTKVYPNRPYPDTSELSWAEIEQISGFTQQQILKVLGFESVDLLPIYINYYFLDPEKLKASNASVYRQLQSIFA